MKVNIKEFNVEMQVKSSGIKFEVRSPNGEDQLGNCYLTMSGLIWCVGKRHKKNGVNISWEHFIAIMESHASVAAAVKAAGKA